MTRDAAMTRTRAHRTRTPIAADRRALDAMVRAARGELATLSRAPGDFDPRRYFRVAGPTEFLNVRTPDVRALSRRVATEHRDTWGVDAAAAYADRCVRDTCFEVKGHGIELLARFRRHLRPAHLRMIHAWLAGNHAANWATTDSICGSLVAPLLLADPSLVAEVASWAHHRNLWVRRASAVSLVKLASRGLALDTAYDVATTLQPDPHDLIHKAAGWLLREAGRSNRARLERYLREQGPRVPRTTLRYAIEHFPPSARQRLLAATRLQARPVSSAPTGPATNRTRPARS